MLNICQMLVDLEHFWSELIRTLKQQQMYIKFLALRDKSSVFRLFAHHCVQ